MTAAALSPDRLVLLAAAFARRRELLVTLAPTAIAKALRLAVTGKCK